jgi:hypothetical protein
MDKDVVTRVCGRLGGTWGERGAARAAARRPDEPARRRMRMRPLYAGMLVWAGVFGLLWVFG